MSDLKSSDVIANEQSTTEDKCALLLALIKDNLEIGTKESRLRAKGMYEALDLFTEKSAFVYDIPKWRDLYNLYRPHYKYPKLCCLLLAVLRHQQLDPHLSTNQKFQSHHCCCTNEVRNARFLEAQ